MLARVPGKDPETVINARIKQARKLPGEFHKSQTWDRGKEMADHQRFTPAIDIKVYFCDPQSPWQRGSNENSNGLLRQYFPKGTDLSVHSQVRLPWPDSSTSAPERHQAIRHRQNDLMRVSHRSLESASKKRHQLH